MTTRAIQLRMMEIFVVDCNLEIHPVSVPQSEWENKRRHLAAKIGSQTVVICKSGWEKFTTYAGFETQKEAQDFKEFQKAVNRA